MPTTDHPPAETGTPPPSRRGRRLPVGPVGLLLTTLVAVLAALAFIRFVAGQDDEEPVRVQDALDQLDAGPVVPDGAEVAEVGQPAPNVRLDYLDGGSQTLDELRGTPVVINFWSSTCAPCLQEMPALQEVSSDTEGKVTFVGVDVADTAEAGSTMVEKTGVTYRNARDPRSEIFARLRGHGPAPHGPAGRGRRGGGHPQRPAHRPGADRPVAAERPAAMTPDPLRAER